MAEYITIFKEQHLINDTEEITETVFDDFKTALDFYCEKQKKFNQIKNILNDGVNKIEFEDEVDAFSENKSECYVRGWVEKDTGDYKANSEMLYTISLEQITKDEYELRKIIYVFIRKSIIDDNAIIDDEIVFETWEEAKDSFEKYYPDYQKILEVVRNTCDGHSICESECLNYENKNLDAFIEALVVENSELYMTGTNMLYHLTVFPEKRNEYEEYKRMLGHQEAIEQPEELPFT